MKTVCAYIRVSTDTQEEYSPDAQVRLLKEYAASHDMTIIDIYQDLGISGRKADRRPEFQDMIAMAKSKEHPYDAILVWKFSRFARNQEESIVYKSLLKKNNVEVISVSEPLPDGVIGELVERIFEWMDEYYSIRLSGEVRRGMTQKALAGGYNANVPCGYTKEKGPNTIPQIDEYYGPMVQRCFHMFAIEHVPMTQIAATINALGYRTRRGNRWESRNITDMLQNPFYIGKIRWNNANSRRSTPYTGEEIVRDGKHQPLISMELWDAAQERYAKITARTGHGKRPDMYKHWLSGLLKCPNCGGTLAYQNGLDTKTGKHYPYFVCYKSVKGMCATRNSISAGKAAQYVLDGLLDIVENKDIKIITPIIPFNQNEATVAKQISSVKAKLGRVKESYINGIDTLEEYKANKEKLEAEIAHLKELVVPEAKTKTVTVDVIRTVHDTITNAQSDSEKATAINSIVDHIIYDKEADTMEFFFVP